MCSVEHWRAGVVSEATETVSEVVLITKDSLISRHLSRLSLKHNLNLNRSHLTLKHSHSLSRNLNHLTLNHSLSLNPNRSHNLNHSLSRNLNLAVAVKCKPVLALNPDPRAPPDPLVKMAPRVNQARMDSPELRRKMWSSRPSRCPARSAPRALPDPREIQDPRGREDSKAHPVVAETQERQATTEPLVNQGREEERVVTAGLVDPALTRPLYRAEKDRRDRKVRPGARVRSARAATTDREASRVWMVLLGSRAPPDSRADQVSQARKDLQDYQAMAAMTPPTAPARKPVTTSPCSSQVAPNKHILAPEQAFCLDEAVASISLGCLPLILLATVPVQLRWSKK